MGLRWRWIGLVLVMLLLTAPLGRADEVNVDGFWIVNVTLQSINDGNLIFVNAQGGEVEKPLSKVQGLKMTAYPDLEKGLAALKDGKDAEAVAALTKVQTAAREPWLRQLVTSQKVLALDRSNKALDAVTEYLKLVALKPEASLLSTVPQKSLTAAPDDLKRDLGKRIEAALAKAGGTPAEAHLKQMLASVQVAAPAPATGETPATGTATPAPAPGTSTPAPGAATPTAPAPGTTEASAATSGLGSQAAPGGPITSVVPLPRVIDAADSVTQQLATGKFQAALDEVNAILQKPATNMAMRLYQRGIAQLNLALAAHDEKMLKDAGLSFARVWAHFPRSPYVGPAMVEAGLVHEKINRPDVARKLWGMARQQLDSELEPEIFNRLAQLQGADTSSPEAAPAPASIQVPTPAATN